MSRLPSALGRRADIALHPIHAGARRRQAQQHAGFALLLIAGAVIGFAVGTAMFAIARRLAGLIETVLWVLP